MLITDTCNWGNRYIDSEQWIRKSATNRTAPAGPAFDGQKNAQGHYLIVNPMTKFNQRADLTSNRTSLLRLKKAYFTCRMNFNYYMSANPMKKNSTYFYVVSGPMISYAKTLWRMTGQVLNQWTQASVAIGEEVFK